MNIRPLTFWLIIWTMVMGIMIFTCSGPNGRLSADLSYGEFMEQVDRGNIAAVTISDTGGIRGQLKQSVKNTTNFSSKTLNADMGYVETLRKDIKSKNPNAVINLNKTGGSLLSGLFSMFPLILLVGVWIWFMRRAQGQQMNGMKSFMKSRTKEQGAKGRDNLKPVTFKDVAGADEAKEELKEIVDFLREPQKYSKLGGRIPRGVLLVGPPGVGKTLLARAVAGEASVPFFSISGSEFVEMFVGVGAGRVRDLFETGKKNAPCIVFIDELDAVGKHRGTGIGGGHDEREQTLDQLLAEMDGFETNAGVVIIAATNRPDVLDPALLRPGRFDRQVVMNKPDMKGRHEILKIHSSKILVDPDVNLEILARGTPGFTGADLANLCNEAALAAGRYDKKTVAMDDFEFAKDKVMMGAARAIIISPKEKEVIATHEAGHVIVASVVPEADLVHKVTIIPRGLSMGSTWQLPESDRHNYSRTHLKSQLAILMAGRCAEELIFNEYSTGASNDIERATELVREMICSWGMSEKLGPLKYGAKNDNPFLGKQLMGLASDYSQATAQQVDEEKKAFIAEAQETATKILTDRKTALHAMARVLVEKETLNGEEVKKMLS